MEASPYFKYFSSVSPGYDRMLTFNFEPSANCDVTNFIEYIYMCYSDISIIDLPTVKGTIYVESCQDDYRCFSPVYQNYVKDRVLNEGI